MDAMVRPFRPRRDGGGHRPRGGGCTIGRRHRVATSVEAPDLAPAHDPDSELWKIAKRQNIEAAQQHPGFTLVEADLRSAGCGHRPGSARGLPDDLALDQRLVHGVHQTGAQRARYWSTNRSCYFRR